MEIKLIYVVAKRSNSIIALKTWPGADCGTDPKLLICKFQVKLKKKKTTVVNLYEMILKYTHRFQG